MYTKVGANMIEGNSSVSLGTAQEVSPYSRNMLKERGDAVDILKYCWNRDANIRRFHEAVREGDNDSVRKYFEVGGDVNALVDDCEHVLFSAVRSGNIEIVALLLKAGANITVKDVQGDPVFFCAVQVGVIEIVRLFLEAGVKVDARTEFDLTALHVAARLGYIEIVRMLLEAGADVNIPKGVCEETVLLVAIRYGWIEIVRMLLEAGARVNCHRSGTFDSVLQYAVKFGSRDMIELLLEYGAKVRAGEIKSDTVLHTIVKNKSANMFELFCRMVRLGANVNAQDRRLNTVLHIAARKGYLDILKFSVKSGADVSMVNEYNVTAIMLARGHNRVACVEFLEEVGEKV